MGFDTSQKRKEKKATMHVKWISKNFRSWGFETTISLNIVVQAAEFTLQRGREIKDSLFYLPRFFRYQCFPKLPFLPTHIHLWIRGKRQLAQICYLCFTLSLWARGAILELGTENKNSSYLCQTNMNNRHINVMKIEEQRVEQLPNVTHSYLIHI